MIKLVNIIGLNAFDISWTIIRANRLTGNRPVPSCPDNRRSTVNPFDLIEISYMKYFHLCFKKWKNTLLKYKNCGISGKNAQNKRKNASFYQS